MTASDCSTPCPIGRVNRQFKETTEFLELAALQWLHWLNHHRLLEPIGYIPPAEENHWKQQAIESVLEVST